MAGAIWLAPRKVNGRWIDQSIVIVRRIITLQDRRQTLPLSVWGSRQENARTTCRPRVLTICTHVLALAPGALEKIDDCQHYENDDQHIEHGSYIHGKILPGTTVCRSRVERSSRLFACHRLRDWITSYAIRMPSPEVRRRAIHGRAGRGRLPVRSTHPKPPSPRVSARKECCPT